MISLIEIKRFGVTSTSKISAKKARIAAMNIVIYAQGLAEGDRGQGALGQAALQTIHRTLLASSCWHYMKIKRGSPICLDSLEGIL
jgi:hypothetical protein